METELAHEGSPLLSGKDDDRRKKSGFFNQKRFDRRWKSWIKRSTRIALILIMISVAGVIWYRLMVWWRVHQAWRSVFRHPSKRQRLGHNHSHKEPSTPIPLDPLQGYRPAFLFLPNVTNTTLGIPPEPVQKPSVPLAIIHGVEITAADMDKEAKWIAKQLPGTYVQSVEYGPGAVTYYTTLDSQFQALCLRLRNHAVFGNTPVIDLLGHSSGAVLARAVAQNVETCWGHSNIQVRHYIGLAGPQVGVIAAIPGFPGEVLARSSIFGPLLASLARQAWAQQYLVATSSYLYDPRIQPIDDNPTQNSEVLFGSSSFVGRLNEGSFLSTLDPLRSNCHLAGGLSECPPASSNSLAGITGRVLLLDSTMDQVIRPTESAFFSRAIVHDGSTTEYRFPDWKYIFQERNMHSLLPSTPYLQALCDNSLLWVKDSIGLYKLWQENRLFFHQSRTFHGPLPHSDYTNVIAPFLNNEDFPILVEQKQTMAARFGVSYATNASRPAEVGNGTITTYLQKETVCYHSPTEQIQFQVLYY